MKKIIPMIVGLLLSSFVSAQEMKSVEQPATYTCVMHPKIHLDKPGNCPICGMKLVKEKPKDEIQSKHDMSDMKMGENNSMQSMSGTKAPKVKLGSIKTIVNNTPPRVVRYDLHIAETKVNFSGKSGAGVTFTY